MYNSITFTILTEKRFASGEDFRTWVSHSLSEDQTCDMVHDLIVGEAIQEFEFFYKGSCLITEKVRECILDSTQPGQTEMENLIEKYQIRNYSVKSLKLGRFAIAFNAMKLLPRNEKVLAKLLAEKLKYTRFDPLVMTISNNDTEVFQFVRQHYPMKDVETYRQLALEKGALEIYKLL